MKDIREFIKEVPPVKLIRKGFYIFIPVIWLFNKMFKKNT